MHHALSGVATGLRLAAAPTFAAMALVTAALGAASPGMLCSPGHDAAALNGMVLMYGLMSAFHLAPWLKLIASQRDRAGRS